MSADLELRRKAAKTTLKWNAPAYTDYPDGEDLMGKLSFTVKCATASSLVLAIPYANNPPKTDAIGKLVRIGKYVIPSAGMAAAFTCVTFFSTVFRKKDDEVNYFLGGAAAGLVAGAAVGKPGGGTILAILFGGIMCSVKAFNMRGKPFFVNGQKKNFSPYYLRKLDTSLIPEEKGNWTKTL